LFVQTANQTETKLLGIVTAGFFAGGMHFPVTQQRQNIEAQIIRHDLNESNCMMAVLTLYSGC